MPACFRIPQASAWASRSAEQITKSGFREISSSRLTLLPAPSSTSAASAGAKPRSMVSPTVTATSPPASVHISAKEENSTATFSGRLGSSTVSPRESVKEIASAAHAGAIARVRLSRSSKNLRMGSFLRIMIQKWGSLRKWKPPRTA